MALIICPECGKRFSDKAMACPECGCPIEYILGSGRTDNNNTAVMTVSNNDNGQAITASENRVQSNASTPEVTGAALRNYLKAVYDLLLEINTIDNVLNSISKVTFRTPTRYYVQKPSEPLKGADVDRSLAQMPRTKEETYAYCLGVIEKAKSYGVPVSDKCYSIIPFRCFPACVDLEAEIYEEYELPEYYRRLEQAEKRYESDLAAAEAGKKYLNDQTALIM